MTTPARDVHSSDDLDLAAHNGHPAHPHAAEHTAGTTGVSDPLRGAAANDRQPGGHGAHGAHPTSTVTRPQLAVVTVLTVLALAAGIALPATKVNLGLSADDVGGLIMPPGMVMTRGTSAEAMRDMAAVDPDTVTEVAPAGARGDRLLKPEVVGTVKTFEFTTGITRWTILPGRQVDAYAVNGQVPGPQLRVAEGDRVRIHVENKLPEPTSIHWHGMILPNHMDGAADVTQEPIPRVATTPTNSRFTARAATSTTPTPPPTGNRPSACTAHSSWTPRTRGSTSATTTSTRRWSSSRSGSSATGSPFPRC